MLADRCLSCLSVCPVLSVMLAYCGQTVGWIKMKLSVQVGLGPGHIVLDGDPAPPSAKWHSPPPIFGPYHVYCGQTAGWMKLVLGTDVGLSPGHIVLDDDPGPPPPKGHSPPQFSAHMCCGQMAAWTKMSLGMELGLGPGLHGYVCLLYTSPSPRDS